MHSFSVIEYFNVGKEALAKFVLIPVSGAINQLGFQRLEKCLCLRIIETDTVAAYSLDHA